MLLAVLIVLVGEGDLSIFRLFQLVVGNGDPMRVAAQLIQYLFGTAKWRFGIDDPGRHQRTFVVVDFENLHPLYSFRETPSFPVRVSRRWFHGRLIIGQLQSRSSLDDHRSGDVWNEGRSTGVDHCRAGPRARHYDHYRRDGTAIRIELHRRLHRSHPGIR